MNHTDKQKANTNAFLRDFQLLEQLREIEIQEESDAQFDFPKTAGNPENLDNVDWKNLVSPFNPKITPGEIRLLSQTERLTYAAVLPWDVSRVLLVPLSNFEFPATDQEMYVEDWETRPLLMRVYQLWNARTVNRAVLARSWVMEQMPERDTQRIQQLLRHIWLDDALEDETIRDLTGTPLLPERDPRKRYQLREQENFSALDAEDLAMEEAPFLLHSPECFNVFRTAGLELQAAAGENTLSECYLLAGTELKSLGTMELEDFKTVAAGERLPEFCWYTERISPECEPWMTVLFRHRETGETLGSGVLTPLPDGGAEVILRNPVDDENTPQIHSPGDIQLIFWRQK